MERGQSKRTSSREPASRTDSNRFLAYSRLHPRTLSSQRSADEPAKVPAIDARLATVYDKMKSNS